MIYKQIVCFFTALLMTVVKIAMKFILCYLGKKGLSTRAATTEINEVEYAETVNERVTKIGSEVISKLIPARKRNQCH